MRSGPDKLWLRAMQIALEKPMELGRFVKDNPKSHDSSNALGETLLHYLAIEDLFEQVGTMLDQGSDIESVDNYGNTALAGAVLAGASKSCSILLKYGANPNVASSSGSPVLHIALRNKRLGTVEELLAAGADLMARSDIGKSVKDIFEEIGLSADLLESWNDRWGGRGGRGGRS